MSMKTKMFWDPRTPEEVGIDPKKWLSTGKKLCTVVDLHAGPHTAEVLFDGDKNTTLIVHND
jgi:hypothetical protein